MLQVPRECQVVSTWRWTLERVSHADFSRVARLTPFLDVFDIFIAILQFVPGILSMGVQVGLQGGISFLERMRPGSCC